MDLWQLHIFCNVIELKSFSKAAHAVHLSQPTVSSHIKELERHFDCILIERLAKQALPTPSGKLLYQYAKQLLDLRDETENALAEYHGRYRGVLAIGGSTIPGNYLLPSIIGGFKTIFPQIRLKLTIGDSRDIIHKTLSGEVELGVIGAHYEERYLQYAAIATDTMRLVVPCGHRWGQAQSVHIDELHTEPFILRESGSGTLKAFKQGLQKINRKVEDFNIVAEMGSTAAVLQGIKSGMGVSILSMQAVQEGLRCGTLAALDIKGLDLKRKFYLVRDNRRTESPLARVFREHLYSAVPP
ncbi:MAG: LysR family transcriptional regulator [Desulfosarcina sp.]|nr:LysR family transcriptional regulator [Desulfobacterales bacterium]